MAEPFSQTTMRPSRVAVDSEAAYALEAEVACPSCQDRITELRVVRLLRTKVNFTSTLPRRGRVMVCPNCATVLSAELGSLS